MPIVGILYRESYHYAYHDLFSSDDPTLQVLLAPAEATQVMFRRRVVGHQTVPFIKPLFLALGVHADGAWTTKHKNRSTISSNSLRGWGKTEEARFAFTCIKKQV